MFMSPDKERLLHLSLYFNANILLVGNKKIIFDDNVGKLRSGLPFLS